MFKLICKEGIYVGIKKFIKRLTVTAMLVTVAMSSHVCVQAAGTTFLDTQGHWAENAIPIWTSYEVIRGYEDGTFRANNYITRGEVACILDRIFQYNTLSDIVFTDLDNSFYREPILKLHHKNIINGYPDGTVQPKDYITRQEMVGLLNNIFKFELTKEKGEVTFFIDQSEISSWARNAVLAFAERGYINGDENKAFNPDANITRAEVVTILNNIIGNLYNTPQTYIDNKGKISIINTTDVTLKDINLKQQLIISEGVGDGDVILEAIKTTEDILVKGGGENSIVIKGDSNIKKIIAWKQESGVRIIIESGANVETLYVEDGSDQVIITGQIDNVVIDSSLNNILFQDAQVKKVIVSGEGTNIEIDEKSKIDTILIGKTASNTTVKVDGKVSKIVSEANDTILYGKGTVEKVELNGDNSQDKLDKPTPIEPELPIDPKPPIEPESPIGPKPPIDLEPTGYNVFIRVDGHGYITVEKVHEIKPPIRPEPPVGEKPNVIIIIDGKGSVLAELVDEAKPEVPLPEGMYEVKIDVDGQGTIIIEKIN